MLGVGTALAPAKFVMYGYREGIEETGNKNIRMTLLVEFWLEFRTNLAAKLSTNCLSDRLKLEKLKNTKKNGNTYVRIMTEEQNS